MTFKQIALIVALILGSALKSSAEVYDFEGFNAVVVRDGVTAIITEGGDYRVEAEARRGDLDRLQMRREGDTLVLFREADWGLFGRGSRDRFRVTISLPELEKIESRSGSHVEVTMAGPDIIGHSTSGASLEIEGIDGGRVAVESLSGASLRLQGRCDDLDALSRSGASIRTVHLTCTDGALESRSGASIRARLTGSAELVSAGGASIRVEGGARVSSQEVSGGASVRVN